MSSNATQHDPTALEKLWEKLLLPEPQLPEPKGPARVPPKLRPVKGENA